VDSLFLPPTSPCCTKPDPFYRAHQADSSTPFYKPAAALIFASWRTNLCRTAAHPQGCGCHSGAGGWGWFADTLQAGAGAKLAPLILWKTYPSFLNRQRKGESMFRKIVVLFIVVVMVLASPTTVKAEKPVEREHKTTGFDQSGYNTNARIFNGTYGQWCMDKIGDEDYCRAVYGTWWNDKLIMKWNAEWDRGNAENWTDSPYNARLSNISNGQGPGGSGDSSLLKMVWVGTCTDGEVLDTGGTCIWGQFAVIMQKASVDGKLFRVAQAQPSGYGYYFQTPE
jgi:hypothetical protein